MDLNIISYISKAKNQHLMFLELTRPLAVSSKNIYRLIILFKNPLALMYLFTYMTTES
jgi:hypothetical protein